MQPAIAFLAGHVDNTDVRSYFFARAVACLGSPNPGENHRDMKSGSDQTGHYHRAETTHRNVLANQQDRAIIGWSKQGMQPKSRLTALPGRLLA
jgi:hypothetical protein